MRLGIPKILFMFCIVLSIISCDKDDDPNPAGPANSPPDSPTNHSPYNGAVDRTINPVLRWECADPDSEDVLTFDVYFGTDSSPDSSELVSQNQVETSFNPGTLDYATTYFWKIVVRDDHDHTRSGNTWWFRTKHDDSDGESPGEERSLFLSGTGIAIKMVWIPAGSFAMGRSNNEQGSSDDEDPLHEVHIDYGFWMSKFEVTQAQWEAITNENPSQRYGTGDDYPVYYVSWDDIHEAFLPEVYGQFRLPSEAEWEYACRAGTQTRFYWGDDPEYVDIFNYAWYSGNSGSQAHEVGRKQPNGRGLYDMSGNVYEWCEDDYHSNYNSAPTDGSPCIEEPRTDYRVLRGGSWSQDAKNTRSASRYWLSPNNKSSLAGFRLVYEGQ